LQLRKKLLKDNGDQRSNTVLAGDEWQDKRIAWRHYTQQLSSTVTSTNDDDDDYSPSVSTSAGNLVLETIKGGLIEFLDTYEETSEKHTHHHNLVSTERMASIEYDRNVRPLMITRNQDFAENGIIKNK